MKLTTEQRGAVDKALCAMNSAEWPVHDRRSMLACPCPTCNGRLVTATLETMLAVDDEPEADYEPLPRGAGQVAGRIWNDGLEVERAIEAGLVTEEETAHAEFVPEGRPWEDAEARRALRRTMRK